MADYFPIMQIPTTIQILGKFTSLIIEESEESGISNR